MTTISKSLSLITTRLTQLSLKTVPSCTSKTSNLHKLLSTSARSSSSLYTSTTAHTTTIITTSNNNPICSKYLSKRQFSSKDDDKDPDAAWKKFQQTIIFDPSSKTTSEAMRKSKKRGGKMLRKKKEKQEALMKRNEDRMFDVGTGQFPPLRFSDEETQRLLKEAYASLPAKGISKKTRQLKRQKNRFRVIREQKRLKKMEKIAAHFKKMGKRSKRVKDVLAVKEGAAEVREKDKEYQMEVLKKWAMINGLMEDNSGKTDDSGVDAGKKQEM